MKRGVELFNIAACRTAITEPSQYTGLALTRHLMGAGTPAVLNCCNNTHLKAATATLRTEGDTVKTLPFEVTKHSAGKHAIKSFDSSTISIDRLVNNVGKLYRTPLKNYSVEAFEQLLQTNITADLTSSRPARNIRLPQAKNHHSYR